jgi:hypothetical protein
VEAIRLWATGEMVIQVIDRIQEKYVQNRHGGTEIFTLLFESPFVTSATFGRVSTFFYSVKIIFERLGRGCYDYGRVKNGNEPMHREFSPDESGRICAFGGVINLDNLNRRYI